MKIIFLFTVFITVTAASAIAQKSFKQVFRIPATNILLPEEEKSIPFYTGAFGLNKVCNSSKFKKFIADLPFVVLKEPLKRKAPLLNTEFSFSDIFENILTSINESLLNTGNDEQPDFFSDAPFAIKIKFIIKL